MASSNSFDAFSAKSNSPFLEGIESIGTRNGAVSGYMKSSAYFLPRLKELHRCLGRADKFYSISKTGVASCFQPADTKTLPSFKIPIGNDIRSIASRYCTDDKENLWCLKNDGALIKISVQRPGVSNGITLNPSTITTEWTGLIKCFGTDDELGFGPVTNPSIIEECKPLYGIRADGVIIFLLDRVYKEGQDVLNGVKIFESVEELDRRVKELNALRKKLNETAKVDEAKEQKIEAARKEAEKRAAEIAAKEKLIAKRKASGLCQHCGGVFKGIFNKTCKECGKPKDY